MRKHYELEITIQRFTSSKTLGGRDDVTLKETVWREVEVYGPDLSSIVPVVELELPLGYKWNRKLEKTLYYGTYKGEGTIGGDTFTVLVKLVAVTRELCEMGG